MAARSGTPVVASQESSAPPISPPFSRGETLTVYAACPATSVGVAGEMLACVPALASPSLSSLTVGVPRGLVPVEERGPSPEELSELTSLEAPLEHVGGHADPGAGWLAVPDAFSCCGV